MRNFRTKAGKPGRSRDSSELQKMECSKSSSCLLRKDTKWYNSDQEGFFTPQCLKWSICQQININRWQTQQLCKTSDKSNYNRTLVEGCYDYNSLPLNYNNIKNHQSAISAWPVQDKYNHISFFIVDEQCGEWGKLVGSMNEESQVRGCYNITFICTNQETVSVLEKTQANKTFRPWKQM